MAYERGSSDVLVTYFCALLLSLQILWKRETACVFCPPWERAKTSLFDRGKDCHRWELTNLRGAGRAFFKVGVRKRLVLFFKLHVNQMRNDRRLKGWLLCWDIGAYYHTSKKRLYCSSVLKYCPVVFFTLLETWYRGWGQFMHSGSETRLLFV